ncbi:MAG TPA: hypothetical protein VGQ33_03850, partial [Vicinamibacteria bacterium]|nr:hypothetical protein [Vicinamibacteria bacterium]
VRAGDYRVRLQIAGDPQRPASAEVARLGEVKATGAFTVVPAAMMSWVDAGAAHLDPGAYTTTVLLPAGTTLQHIEVAPPCLNSVEPLGGWKPTAILDTGDAAVTMVRALDAEPALPAADAPIEVDSAMFRSESGMMAAAADGLQGLWLKAGPGGLRAIVLVTIPEPGLYTISAYGILAAGQSWTADACRKSILCAAKDPHAADGPQWRPVLTSDFSAGPHVLSVVLGPGAGIERVRAERKKNAVEGYVAVLRTLGFDVGAPGPMPRDRANEAMRFLEKRITPLHESGCGDIVLPNLTIRAGLEVAQVPGPAQAPPGAGTGQPPLGGPLVPPSSGPTPSPQPSTPVTPPSTPPASAPPSSPPPSSPPTPGPSPTPLAPPPTLPSPSPASPVQPLRGSPVP